MANESYVGNLAAEITLVTPARPEPDDSEPLVRASQRGHREAFGRLYQRYAPMVHGMLLARVPRLEVEDLVHEVFLRALSRLHSLRDTTRFGAWLAAIARNMANDYYRDVQTHTDRSANSGDAEEADAGGEQAETREATEILEIIRTLPEAYRETLLLR